jgi:hypothetical protein
MSPTRRSVDLAARTPAILIRNYGAYARIHPARPEMLVDLLVERKRFRSDGRGGLRRETEPEYLFDLDPDGVLNVPAGLVPRLAAAARRAGYTGWTSRTRRNLRIQLPRRILPAPSTTRDQASPDRWRAVGGASSRFARQTTNSA